MGTYATIKGLDKCPICRNLAEWQSKGLWLTYKDREFWIGDYSDIELDENMNGYIVCYCFNHKMGKENHTTYYKIIKGKLIKSSEDEYQN